MKIRKLVKYHLLAASFVSATIGTPLFAKDVTWNLSGTSDSNGIWNTDESNLAWEEIAGELGVYFENGDDVKFSKFFEYSDITIEGKVNPNSIELTKSYNFKGEGELIGSGSMSLDNGARIEFANSNADYAGEITINNAILVAHHADSLGKGKITVLHTEEDKYDYLLLNEGATSYTGSGSRTIDVYGEIRLQDQIDTKDHSVGEDSLTMNIYDGARIMGYNRNRSDEAFSEIVSVYTTLQFDENVSTVTFTSENVKGISLQQAVTLDTVYHVEGSLTLGTSGTSTINHLIGDDEGEHVDDRVLDIRNEMKIAQMDSIEKIELSEQSSLEFGQLIKRDYDDAVQVSIGQVGDSAVKLHRSETASAESYFALDRVGQVEITAIEISNADFQFSEATENFLYVLYTGATMRDCEGLNNNTVYSLEGDNAIINADLTGSTIISLAQSEEGEEIPFTRLTLSNVKLGKGNVFMLGLGGNIVLENSTIDSSALLITPKSLTGLTLAKSAPSLLFRVEGLDMFLTAQTMDGSHAYVKSTGQLTLDLGDLEGGLSAFNAALAAGETVGIELENIESLSDLLVEHGDYSDILIRVDGMSSGMVATGMIISQDSRNVVLTYSLIPEPSTATLSLMALAGLLARRRRVRSC